MTASLLDSWILVGERVLNIFGDQSTRTRLPPPHSIRIIQLPEVHYYPQPQDFLGSEKKHRQPH
jgi:hypothetical protein